MLIFEQRTIVNKDVELRKGGRTAVKMSIEDFKNEMSHTYKEFQMESEADVSQSYNNRPKSPASFVVCCCRDRSKSKIMSALTKDVWENKYKFDSENFDTIGGIKMSSKGFPYIQANAGGDWESPVCIFIYYDGNKFRGYVPLKGNAINRDLKQALGNDDEKDAKFIKKDTGNENADIHNVGYDLKLCLEDFLSRVEVKGSYKRRDYTSTDKKYEEYKKQCEADRKAKDEEREKFREEAIKDTKEKPVNGEEYKVFTKSEINEMRKYFRRK